MAAVATSSAAASDDILTGPNVESRLASLPEELLSNISIKLGSDDICAFRLTCKDVEVKTGHEFAKEYFSEKCFMFTSESLKTLVNIARSKKLRGYLQHVYLLTARIEDPSNIRPHLHGNSCCCWQPTVRQREALIRYLNDQTDLRKTRGSKAFLIDAFSNLPALRGLSLVDSLQMLPFTVDCHGLAKFGRTTGTRPTYAPREDVFPLDYSRWLSHCWNTMILAVAESQKTTLKSLETLFQHYSHGISPIEDLRFRPSTLEKLRSCLAKLESVSVHFRTRNLEEDEHASPDTVSKSVRRTKVFATVLQSVTKAKVTLDYQDTSGAICKALVGSLNLTRLTEMEFDSICLDAKTLATIVYNLKSAQKITFHAIDLTSGTWVMILQVLKQLPQLNHLHLQYLQQKMQKVYFLEQPEEETEDPDLAGWTDPLDSHEFGGEEDWGSDSGDELPDQNPTNEASTNAAPEPDPKPIGDVLQKPADKCKCDGGEFHQLPAMKGERERGYYVCLPTREHIQEQLPLFIRDYNLGNNLAELDALGAVLAAFGPPPGMTAVGGATVAVPMPPGPPPNANALTNMLNNIIPFGPPHVQQQPAAANPAPNAGVHANTLSTMLGNIVQFGPPLPPHMQPPAAANPASNAGSHANPPVQGPAPPPPSNSGTAPQPANSGGDWLNGVD